ncbi:MAG: hypothetical protein IKK39_03625, partial [Thermoguttaceae bacterium]|nr:hypothetical protein [Thermoguttaceae bacterium]
MTQFSDIRIKRENRRGAESGSSPVRRRAGFRFRRSSEIPNGGARPRRFDSVCVGQFVAVNASRSASLRLATKFTSVSR